MFCSVWMMCYDKYTCTSHTWMLPYTTFPDHRNWLIDIVYSVLAELVL